MTNSRILSVHIITIGQGNASRVHVTFLFFKLFILEDGSGQAGKLWLTCMP